MTADPIGGVWTYAIDLARALGESGVAVVLATMGAAPTRTQRAEAMRLPNVELHESDFALEWMEHPWQQVDRAGQWLLGLEAQTRPNVVHLNGFSHAVLPWRAPVVVVAHSCVLSWWQAVKGVALPNEWREYQRRVQAGLQAADWVVAPTQDMLAMLEQNHGRLAKSEVIPNGRDARNFRTGKKEPFIFSAGRFWDEAKNLSTLEEAAAGVAWPVLVAGSKGGHGPLVRLGRLSSAEMADRLARAAIYCLPASYEPFGLSALEAALSGCALVLGDIPSLREVWGDAALFVAPHDATALADRLRQLIGNETRRAAFARRAQEQAQQFTAERMAERYLALYGALVRQPRDRQNAA